jgi:CheY-like chemotaxis protein
MVAKSILIAGIDKQHSDMLGELLEKMEHQTTWVANWERAQELLSGNSYDLLFLDELLEEGRK